MLVAQSCPTLCNSMDYSPPGSSVHGILQARTLEWVTIPFSRGSSQPRDWSWVSALQTDSLPSEPPMKPNTCLNHKIRNTSNKPSSLPSKGVRERNKGQNRNKQNVVTKKKKKSNRSQWAAFLKIQTKLISL